MGLDWEFLNLSPSPRFCHHLPEAAGFAEPNRPRRLEDPDDQSWFKDNWCMARLAPQRFPKHKRSRRPTLGSP
jgi:hypothetical protein